MQELVDEARQLVVKDIASCIGAMELLMWPNVKTSEHRRVVQDMWESMAAISMFFPNQNNAKMKSWLADCMKRSSSSQPTITDNAAKARMAPYLISPKSAATLLTEFWSEPDEILKRGRIPRDWGQFIRPMVARLLKAGLIDPGFEWQVWGTTVAATPSPDMPKSMYIDYRKLSKQNIISMDHLRDPTSIDILATAQN